ncbi:MAG: lycopene beta-cyclase CrtY [Gammaproteobacteria bacterium]
MTADTTANVLLVGGGLANCLLALRFRSIRPDLSICVLESADRLGGNHTWSFHSADVSPQVLSWLQPLASHSWSHYDVRFPERKRRLDGGYHSLKSGQLHSHTLQALGSAVRLNSAVETVAGDHVRLADGEVLRAGLVIDGRGAGQSLVSGMTLRYQKFLGQHVRLATEHGLDGPLLMDATVDQAQGYRFIYVLPFSATELLIEDTYYSDDSTIDTSQLRQNIASYAMHRGWRIEAMLLEEAGLLPIVLDCDLETFWPAADAVPRSGLRAGLFHHTTGYSLPEAAALADELPRQAGLTSVPVSAWIRQRTARRWRDQRIFRLLNRMLFLAAQPAERFRILQHFYRLPTAVIERFYAGRLSTADAGRILSGRPPVPIHRALRYVLPASSQP